MVVKENDLVMLRLSNKQTNNRTRKYNTWFRVMFIDNDNTFIGRVEKVDRFEFNRYDIGKDVRLNVSDVLRKYEDGDQ